MFKRLQRVSGSPSLETQITVFFYQCITKHPAINIFPEGKLVNSINSSVRASFCAALFCDFPFEVCSCFSLSVPPAREHTPAQTLRGLAGHLGQGARDQ